MKVFTFLSVVLCLGASRSVAAFRTSPHHYATATATATRHCSGATRSAGSSFLGRCMSSLDAHRHLTTNATTFDPLDLATTFHNQAPRVHQPILRPMVQERERLPQPSDSFQLSRAGRTAMQSTALIPLALGADKALADSSAISAGYLDPSKFQPVCPTSDVFYRGLQTFLSAIVGDEAFVQYGPLIAGGLLRVRLELCVVESFFKEAVGPFIQKNGVSWILPIHETVETFLAGAIFALATTFILIGSTKILTVIVFYADLLLGLPFRLLGGFAYDRAIGKPVTLDLGIGPFKTRVIGPPKDGNGAVVEKEFDWGETNPGSLVVILLSGAFRFTGQAMGAVRQVLEAVDSFVGRYLVLVATFYLAVKFLHFKVFPDFP